jgi:26S proteasome regulatory subunit T5
MTEADLIQETRRLENEKRKMDQNIKRIANENKQLDARIKEN